MIPVDPAQVHPAILWCGREHGVPSVRRLGDQRQERLGHWTDAGLPDDAVLDARNSGGICKPLARHSVDRIAEWGGQCRKVAASLRRRRDDALRSDLERASDEQRAIRRELADGEGPDGGAALELGIGGSRNPEALKCLHAHVAFALARPGYRLGEAILDEVPERWPGGCCADLSLASPR